MKTSIATQRRATYEQSIFQPTIDRLAANESLSKDTIEALQQSSTMLSDVNIEARLEGQRLALMAVTVAIAEMALDPESLTAIKGVGPETVEAIKSANRKGAQ